MPAAQWQQAWMSAPAHPSSLCLAVPRQEPGGPISEGSASPFTLSTVNCVHQCVLFRLAVPRAASRLVGLQLGCELAGFARSAILTQESRVIVADDTCNEMVDTELTVDSERVIHGERPKGSSVGQSWLLHDLVSRCSDCV